MLRSPNRVSQMGAATRKIFPPVRALMVRKIATPPKAILVSLNVNSNTPL